MLGCLYCNMSRNNKHLQSIFFHFLAQKEIKNIYIKINRILSLQRYKVSILFIFLKVVLIATSCIVRCCQQSDDVISSKSNIYKKKKTNKKKIQISSFFFLLLKTTARDPHSPSFPLCVCCVCVRERGDHALCAGGVFTRCVARE